MTAPADHAMACTPARTAIADAARRARGTGHAPSLRSRSRFASRDEAASGSLAAASRTGTVRPDIEGLEPAVFLARQASSPVSFDAAKPLGPVRAEQARNAIRQLPDPGSE